MDATQLRAARKAAGLSQRALGERAGMAQPHIARIESGRINPTPTTMATLEAALLPLPSAVLRARKQEVLDTVRAHRGTDVRVFGSVARGEDRPDSDVDLLVDFESDADLFDVVALELALEDLLGRPVDVLPASSTGRAATTAAQDAVPL